MLFGQYIIATLMASASVTLAVPTPDIVDLTVRSEDGYGVEYRRSPAPVQTFVCKRDMDARSLGCIEKREAGVDESRSASLQTKRESVETFVCKRENQSLSCLRRREAVSDESLSASTKREPMPVENFVCKRENQSLSCLRKKEVTTDQSQAASV